MNIAVILSEKGFHWEEYAAAYLEFARLGADVEIFTPAGGFPSPDPYSVRKTGVFSRLGFGVPGEIALDAPAGKRAAKTLEMKRPVAGMDPHRFDVLYLAGGHGCLFDLNVNRDLHEKIRKMHAKGSVLSGVCHATSTFALAGVAGGKKLTGFPEGLDKLLLFLGLVHEDLLPIPFSNEKTLEEHGAVMTSEDKVKGFFYPGYALAERPFVTGVGPKAARRVAELAVRMAQGEI
ncbi:MAG: hypothetical protein GF408_03640 [Candidatus Omnitrophica bacterium]|nr:hypothetical protein [Candidatus Omnitrophota bacterium]